MLNIIDGSNKCRRTAIVPAAVKVVASNPVQMLNRHVRTARWRYALVESTVRCRLTDSNNWFPTSRILESGLCTFRCTWIAVDYDHISRLAHCQVEQGTVCYSRAKYGLTRLLDQFKLLFQTKHCDLIYKIPDLKAFSQAQHALSEANPRSLS